MFTFIKETWELARMLFSSKPSDFDCLQLKEMKCYPAKKYKCMTWCGACIVREGTYHDGDIPQEDSNHENIHLTQAKDCKTWIKFYTRYLWSWFRLSPLFGKYGYYLNKFETEAYAKEEDFGYIARRPEGNVEKFDQPDKKQVWASARKMSYFYKIAIKEKFKDV